MPSSAALQDPDALEYVSERLRGSREATATSCVYIFHTTVALEM